MTHQYSLIENAQLVLETGILWDAELLICDEKIVAFGKQGTLDVPADTYRIDAHGAYVGPGFIDIHVHGINGCTTCFETKQAAEIFLRHGATSILATPDYSMNLTTFLDAIRSIKAAMPEAKTVRGMYLEGPYMNPNYGCNAHINPWRHPIAASEFTQLVDAAGTDATVWAIACR